MNILSRCMLRLQLSHLEAEGTPDSPSKWLFQPLLNGSPASIANQLDPRAGFY